MSTQRECFLDAAAQIGRRLCRDAIWWDGRCNWLGWAMEAHGGQWVTVHRAMGPLVYDGTAGIGLFLAQLAAITDDPIVRTTATGALAQALTAADPLARAGEYGFYAGLSGIAWCCTEAGAALDNDEFGACGRAAMLRAAGLERHAQRLDIVNGSAGLIPALLSHRQQERRDVLLGAAERHGEHLIERAARTDHGWSWDTLGTPSQRHLLGFAHGASGIAYALAMLGARTARADFFRAAEEALSYERAHFRASEGNWPDFREFEQSRSTGDGPSMLAWCHGAPGVGFARLALQTLMRETSSNRAEADIALRSTLATLGHGASGIGNFSLCHGDGGNADLLLFGADILDRPQLRQEAEAVGLRALERFEHAGMPWPCGVPNAGETPNLLLGLAGIGHFFLRLYDSRSVSTVLLPGSLS